jgi:protein-S-isoprenylcysteine O-methyltransferase Ste14
VIGHGANARKMGNEMNTIVIVVLVLLLVGVLPTWPHSADWGYFTSGGLGLILLVLVILALTGRQARGETVTTVQTRARHPRSVARDWRRSKEPGCVTPRERT